MPVDIFAIVLKLVEVAPKLMPPPKPPKTNYLELIDQIPNTAALYQRVQSPTMPFGLAPAEPIEMRPVMVTRVPKETVPGEKTTQQTGCIPCARSHLSTVSGALGESLRFAREGGITHPEALRRVHLAEDEINIMERVDLSADALAQSPPDQQELAREYLPHIRELRQDIGAVDSLDALEKVAADASILSQEFRLRHLQLRGVDLNPVLALARRVQDGSITMRQAKEELKGLIPEEA